MSGAGRFHTTKWSVIRSARAKDEPGSAEALAHLCEAYWYPLYYFVRRTGPGADESRDLAAQRFGLLGQVDDTHSPLADLADDAVGADRVVRLQRFPSRRRRFGVGVGSGVVQRRV
jgi:hypothetical protein